MRKAALGLVIGAVMVVVLFVGRMIMKELSGANWPVRAMSLNFRDLPKQLGDWNTIESGELLPEVFDILGAVDAENRVFQNSRGDRVSYHGALFGEFWVAPAHTPFQCYPARGWEMLDQKTLEIPLSDGTIFKPTMVTFERNGAKALVLFWFQCGDFVVVNGEQQRRALEHYRPRKEWPSMFKVMLHIPMNANFQNDEPLKDLAVRIFEYTRTMQEGKAPHPQPTPQPHEATED
ncbi:MAG: exosortase-associated EpsI family protein [Planctomycetia bacterium]